MAACDNSYSQQIIPLEAIQVKVIQPVLTNVAKQSPNLEIVYKVIIKNSIHSAKKKKFSLKKDITSSKFMTNKYFSYHSHTLHSVKKIFFS